MNRNTKKYGMEELRDCTEEVIYYDGMKFILNELGYYRCWTKSKGLRLHRYLWEKENGEIPKGFHIHHIDGDKRNNHISNLEMLSSSDHGKKHRDHFMNIRIQPTLSADWRKQNYENSKHLMHEEVEIECKVCRTKVMKRKYAKYCSQKCRNKYNNNKVKTSL